MAIAHSNGLEVPPYVTARQLGDIVTMWLKAHPEYRHAFSSVATLFALQTAFPASNQATLQKP
jgi:D-alanyl-D-alanine carboxypeptidase